MARLLPDGSPDPTFDGDGILETAFAPANYDDYAESLAIGADGSLLVGVDCEPAGVDPFCVLKVGASNGVPQYADGSNDWDTPSAGHFAACLRAVGSASATWTLDATCPASDGLLWSAVPNAPSQVAVANGSTAPATASFRFGLRVPASQAPGAYVAPITFDVLAP